MMIGSAACALPATIRQRAKNAATKAFITVSSPVFSQAFSGYHTRWRARQECRLKVRVRVEMRALDGIFVVALEQAVAAPYCTSRLADAGARVIKIERPEGDFARNYDHVAHGESAYFVWLNRGKESIVLDLKQEAALLERMIANADVFVQSLAPGAAERAGFGSGALRERYPRLI